MLFKRFLVYICYYSVEQNHLCNFGRGHYGEHSFCYFKFGPVVQEMLFKDKVDGHMMDKDRSQ